MVRSRQKPYWEMTTEELAEATREFDREDLSPPVPLRGQMLARYERARTKHGGPKLAGKAVNITLPSTLLVRVDRAARRQKLTRSQWVTQALRAELKAGVRRRRQAQAV